MAAAAAAGFTLVPEYAPYELLYGEPLEADLANELEEAAAVDVAIVLVLPPPLLLVVNMIFFVDVFLSLCSEVSKNM